MGLITLLMLSMPGMLLAQDWSWAFGAYSANHELAKDVAVNDSLGEVWVLGEFDGPVASLPGMPTPGNAGVVNGLLIKLDTNGALQDYIVIPSAEDLQMNAIALDDSGNVYVTGAFSEDVIFTGNGTDSIGLSPSIVFLDCFVAKFNPGLEGVWATRVEGLFNQIGKDVAINGPDVVIAGDFQSNLSSDTLSSIPSSGSYDAFVMSFTKGAGVPRWSTKLGGNGADRVEGIVCHRGDIYLAGHFDGDSLYFPGNRAGSLLNSNPGSNDFFVARIDTLTRTGDWLVRGGGVGEDFAHGIAFSSGGVFVGGEISGNAGFGAAGSVVSAGGRDGYVTGLDAGTGAFQWVRPEGGAGDEAVWDVARDRLGNVIAAGEYSNTVIFSGGIPATPVSGTDGFLVGYETNGTPVSWLRRVGNNDIVSVRDIDAGESGIYASGEYFFSTATFFASTSVTVPGDGMSNLFAARMGCEQIPNPNLSATVNSDSICAGDSVEVSIPLSLNSMAYQLIELGGDTLGPVVPGVNGPLTLVSDALDSSLSIGILVYGNGISCDVLAEDSLGVFVQGTFSPDLGPDDSSCAVPLVLRPQGTWSSYLWSTGATTDSLLAGISGSYDLEVTDSLGCIGRDTIVVLISPNPVVNLGADTTICQGDSLNLDAGTGALTYGWSTGATANSIWVNSAGNYSVTITDTLGCSASDTLILGLDSVAIGLPSDTSFCLGDSVLLDAGPGGSGYLWSTGASSQAIFVGVAGIYDVEVSSGGCTDSATVVVSTLALPQPELGPDTTLCNVSAYLLDGATGGVSSYLWSTGASSPTLSAVNPGAYSILVTDTAGCTGADTVDIAFENLTVNLPLDTSFCEGDSVVLDAGNSGSNFTWSTGATTQAITVATNGAYGVTISNGNCSDSALVNVVELALPEPDLGRDTVLCNASVYVLGAATGGASSYLWSTGDNTASIAVGSAGAYSVLVTDTAGCVGADTVNVDFESIVLTLPSDTSFCSGDSVILNAGVGGNNYLWSTGDSSQTISVSTGGIYGVTVSGMFCADSASVNVSALALPQPNLGPDTALCNAAVYQLNAFQPGFDLYQWNTGSTDSTLDVSSSGTYIVTVTDGDGCQGIDSAVVTIEALTLLLPTDTSFCAGDSVFLDAGNGWGSYQWSSGASSQGIWVTSGGTYGVTVNGSVCLDSAQVNVTAGSLPGLDLGPDTVLCNAGSYLLDANVPGASSYQWSGGATTATLQVVAAGFYQVTVEDGNGCQATDGVNVDFVEVALNLPSDTAFCQGGSVTLDATTPGGSYQWSNGANSADILVSSSGAFGVTVTVGSCADSALVNVQAGVLPGLDLGPDTSLCLGDSLLLLAGSGNLNYNWQDGSTNNGFLVSMAGVYWVDVSDSAGCSASDTIEVVYGGDFVVEVNGLAARYCESDDSVLLNAQPSGGTWSAGGGTFDPAIGPGNYLLGYTYTDAQGCSGQWMGATVVDGLPDPAAAGPDQELEGSLLTMLNANIPSVGTGVWTGENAAFASSLDAQTQVNFPGPGNYVLTWTISNGVCPENQDSLRITIDGLSIPSGFSPNGDGRNETFVIRGLGAYPKRAIQIFNRWGNVVYSADAYNNDWTGGQLVDDTYFYVLDLGESGQHSGYVVLKR